MIDVNDKNFNQEVLDFEGIVFIDFWAPWCGPCKMMMPNFNKLSESFSGTNVKFVKYEVGAENCTEILKEYSITNIPSFVALKQNKTYEKLIGSGDLKSFVTKIIDASKVNS
jgi:thioredoxin 1